MRKYFILPAILLTAVSSFGQNTKRNIIYGEAFGNAISIFSLNYERQLQDKPGLGMHIGIGFFSDYPFSLSLPIGVNYLIPIRNEKSFIDAGAGVTFSTAQGIKTFKQEQESGPGEYDFLASFVPSIGYRQHVLNSKLMWRASFCGIINKYRSFPFVGFAAGYRF